VVLDELEKDRGSSNRMRARSDGSRMKQLMAALVLVLLAVACASGPSNDENGPATGSPEDPADKVVRLKTLELVDACLEDGDQACELCRARGRSRVSECFSSCSNIAARTGNSSCYNVCGDLGGNCDFDCSGDPSACRRRGFQFRAIGPRDADVGDACDAAVARDQACKEQNVLPMCRISERVEKPEATDAYLCVSKLQCGRPSDDCLATLHGSIYLGQEAKARCPEAKLSPSLVETLDAVGGWARDEVIEDLAVCSQFDCLYEYEDCLTAWAALMTGAQGYY
jgi:hypothetical protein